MTAEYFTVNTRTYAALPSEHEARRLLSCNLGIPMGIARDWDSKRAGIASEALVRTPLLMDRGVAGDWNWHPVCVSQHTLASAEIERHPQYGKA